MHGSYYFQVKSHQIWGGTTKQLWNITLTSNIITIPCIVLQCIIVSSFKHISILKFLQLYKPTYKQLLLYPSDHSRSTHSCRDITVLVWRTVWPLKYLVKPFRAFYTTEVTFSDFLAGSQTWRQSPILPLWRRWSGRHPVLSVLCKEQCFWWRACIFHTCQLSFGRRLNKGKGTAEGQKQRMLRKLEVNEKGINYKKRSNHKKKTLNISRPPSLL